jgi:hypothetical protein
LAVHRRARVGVTVRVRRRAEALEPWLREELGLISQKTRLAEAVRYALSRWEGLTHFLDDRRIEMASNVVERKIRPLVLNGKNALFAGIDGGGGPSSSRRSRPGNSAASIPSLTSPTSSSGSSTAHPNSRFDQLLPRAHAPADGLKTVA